VSGYGHPDCSICGAHTDYCTLTTASGISIDCRDLQLKNMADLAWNIELAKSLHSDHTDTDEQSHDLQACGHPVEAIYSSDEGTSYCRTCAHGGAA
jgi:hypothetical protein